MTDEPQEALRRVEERLSEASDAAERLIAETRRKRPPSAGWQAPTAERERERQRPPELELLHAGARLLDELIPPEVIERLAAALRELLLAVRAMLDFYSERLGQTKPDGEERVKDIPIE